MVDGREGGGEEWGGRGNKAIMEEVGEKENDEKTLNLTLRRLTLNFLLENIKVPTPVLLWLSNN